MFVPCRTCGAPLPLAPALVSAACASCGTSQPLDVAAVARVRAHLAALAGASARAGDNASEADYYRRWRSKAYGYAAVLGLNAVMVGGGWGLVFAYRALEGLAGDAVATLVMGAIGVVALLVVCVGWAYVLARRKEIAIHARPSVGRARCAACGASLPVRSGALPECPFCEATLLPDVASMARARADLERLVDATAAEAQGERDAYASGLRRAEQHGRTVMAIVYGALVGMMVFGMALIALVDSSVGSPLLDGAAIVGSGTAGAWAGIRIARWRRAVTGRRA